MTDSAGNYQVEGAANTVIAKAEKAGVVVDPMKLQKLVYLAHGYYLAITGCPLVDEQFEAWQFGPVSPTIYHEFKRYGSFPLKKGERATRTIFCDDGSVEYVEPCLPDEEIDEAANVCVDYVIEEYGGKSAIYLSDLTHKVGSPWEITRAKDPKQRHARIDNSLIQTYFERLVE